jgi:hypothetical protein
MIFSVSKKNKKIFQDALEVTNYIADREYDYSEIFIRDW